MSANKLQSLKWLLFYSINRFADSTKRGSHTELTIDRPERGRDDAKPLAWIFCSTIGEVNACLPLLMELEQRYQLVVLTDHDCYRDSYRKTFKEAFIIELTGRITDGQVLMTNLRPSLFVVCEIPSLPCEAPCRLSYSLMRAAKTSKARCALVNAWLYQYPAACRMDAVESTLFTKTYLKQFDFIGAQTEDVKEQLIRHGAFPDRICVTGNMKFDALLGRRETLDSENDILLKHIRKSRTRTFVAGCLSDITEWSLICRAIACLKTLEPDTLYIVAPRHPENSGFMRQFFAVASEHGVPLARKSTLKSIPQIASDVIVLDTFGELRSYYQEATVAYVGTNHNVLEPLTYRKPTIVSGRWNRQYPSYPVYELAKQHGLVSEVDSDADLVNMVSLKLNKPIDQHSHGVEETLVCLAGATQKTLARIVDHEFAKHHERQPPK